MLREALTADAWDLIVAVLAILNSVAHRHVGNALRNLVRSLQTLELALATAVTCSNTTTRQSTASTGHDTYYIVLRYISIYYFFACYGLMFYMCLSGFRLFLIYPDGWRELGRQNISKGYTWSSILGISCFSTSL